MYKPIFCISQDIRQAGVIVNNLKLAGFSTIDISVLFPYSSSAKHTKAITLHDTDNLSESGAELEWSVGIDNVETPGVGRFFASGPIMIELNRPLPKDSYGDLMDALMGVGIPAHEDKHYQEKIKTGCTLIAINTASLAMRDSANSIFQEAKATDISSSEEASAIV
jgi:hypothetical protein